MNSIAPMSTPRVGCETSRSFGGCSNSRYGRLAIVNAENRILSQTEIKQQSATMSIFRDVRDAQFLSGARIKPRDVPPLERNRTRNIGAGNQSRQGFNQLSLAVAFDAGDADDLACAHFKGNLIDAFGAVASGDRKIVQRNQSGPGFGVGLFDSQQNVSSHHQARQLRRISGAGFHVANYAAVAHDRNVV